MLFKANGRSWVCLFTLLAFFGIPAPILAAQLFISWTDNSANEQGFRIERRIVSSNTYQQIASVAFDVTNYTDSTLANSTTYCYRVLAFNSSDTSVYSNESCATTSASVETLTVTRSGTGSGTVTSAPAGISCGADCSENYSAGSVVTLSAIAASGSVFAGWSGHADCADGTITVNAAISCTASFNTAPPQLYTLTTQVISEVTSAGSASGRVTSNPTGIDCESDCTQTYVAGQAVTLTPIAAANSQFAGWSGDSDCSDGTVTMSGARSCSARFQLKSATLSVHRIGKGSVKAAGTGIDCGASCVYSGALGTVLTLRATPEVGAVFTGWSGGCSGLQDCTLTLLGDIIVAANFASGVGDKIGLYRPQEGNWYLDRNGSGEWDGCTIDSCIQLSGGSGTVPVVGDWTNSGKTKVGFFVSGTNEWFLDRNGNGVWDGCDTDLCSSFGNPTDIPMTGRWLQGTEDRIAVFRPAQKRWYLDRNGNELLDQCKIDKCAALTIYQLGDIPITGDWTGRGLSQFGLYRPSTGQWFLDRNANTAWNGCRRDLCIASFGDNNDIPVAGDWGGTGVDKIGVFRPATGEWFLDFNGNGRWDGPAVDIYVEEFGQAGDIPLVGNW